jgi:hypothetical protein
MTSSGMLGLVALVRTDVSEEGIPSIMRVEGIGELESFNKSHIASHPGRWYSS